MEKTPVDTLIKFINEENPTNEQIVEKLNNKKARDMDRKEFVKLCLSTLKEILPDFVADWKKIGMSCDFNVY